MQSVERETEIVWTIPSMHWIRRTLQQVVDETPLDKHHKLALHLGSIYPVDTPCEVGVRGARSITIENTEYRIRHNIVYERKI